MKYRIKDPRKREVVRQFFNREVFDLEEGDVLDMRLYSKLRGGLDPVPLLLEPVLELAEGGHARLKEIKTLIDLLCDATCLAGGLSESSDFGKADRRKFRALERHLSETWFAIFECYYKEIDEEGSEDEVPN